MEIDWNNLTSEMIAYLDEERERGRKWREKNVIYIDGK